MVQVIQKIERLIKERQGVDVPLINWWLQFLLLSWVTFYIYPIYLFFKRCSRIDAHIERKRKYYQSVIEYTEQYSQEKNKYDVVRNEIGDLKAFTENNSVKKINGGLSFLLMLLTFFVYWFIFMYKINKVWDRIQKFEAEYYDRLSQIWKKIGVLKYPINLNIDNSKNRSYVVYLLLSIATFGIYGLIWDYKIHTDPDNLYKELHGAEDVVLNTVRSS